jgi:hypothetical protein
LQVVRRYLPALMSLGSVLGVALHSLLYSWDTYVSVTFTTAQLLVDTFT